MTATRTRIGAVVVALAASTTTIAGTASAVPALAPTSVHAATVAVAPAVSYVASTTLPRRVEVGAPETTVNFKVNTTLPATSVIVRLRNYRLQQVAVVTLTNGVAGKSFSGRITLRDAALPTLGAYSWQVQPIITNQPNVAATDVFTTVKAHALLGLAPLSRKGGVITATGSLRVYNTVKHVYLRWTGRPVQLQRYSTSGWVTVQNLTTDRYGDIHTMVRIPFRVGLRLVVGDTPTVFGRVSNSNVI